MMNFFGRRKTDLIPVPPEISPKAIIDLNRFAELGVIAVVGIFFGTLWTGVQDSRTRLITIESDLKGIPIVKQDIKDLEIRVRALEQRK